MGGFDSILQFATKYFLHNMYNDIVANKEVITTRLRSKKRQTQKMKVNHVNLHFFVLEQIWRFDWVAAIRGDGLVLITSAVTSFRSA